MSVVGFDLGNENCVVAVARQRGIDVILNQESKRETPAVISFGDRQRLVGSAASASAVMNPANSVTQIKRLIGRSFAEVRDELALFPFRVSEGPDGLPRVDVRYLGEHRAFTPTQVLGMLLSHLKSLAEKHLKVPVSDCCIGIPAFFTDPQRRAVLDAAAIAGLRPLRLIHEATAAALEYGIYKTGLPDTDALNVAFVDVGHASTQVCVASYCKGRLKVLAHAFDRSLGGRDFDEALFRHFAAEFQGKTGIDVSANARACVRLRAACEKLKKMLSANAEAPLNVECLVEDQDFRGFLRREEFERIADPILGKVRAPLEKVIGDAGLRVEDIHVVEVFGSGSRVPAIVKILTNFFGKEPRRTLNTSECVARGCALQCAMLSPTFKVREFQVDENFPFNVDVLWKVPSCGPTKESAEVGKSSRAFSKGDPIPITRALQLSTESLFSVDLFYPDASELGVPEMISQYKVGPSQSTNYETTAFKIVLSLNLHGILSVDSAIRIEEFRVPANAKTSPAVDAQLDRSDASSKSINSLGMEEGDLLRLPKDSEVEVSKVGTGDATDHLPGTGSCETTNAWKSEFENGIPSTKTNSESRILEADPKAEVVKKSKNTPVLLSDSVHGWISPASLQTLIEEEAEMALQDKIIEETKDKKNAVETYVYDMRNKINDKYKDFVSDSERNVISTKLQEAEDWLYDEGEDAMKSVYIDRLKDLKTLGDPIEMRYKEDSERQISAGRLYHCIQSFQNAVLTNDPRLDHIEITEKQKVVDACHQAQNWLNQSWQQQGALPKYANPVLLSANITKYTQEFDSYCKKILLKPKAETNKVQKETKVHAAAGEQPAAGNGSGEKETSPDDVESTVNGENAQTAIES